MKVDTKKKTTNSKMRTVNIDLFLIKWKLILFSFVVAGITKHYLAKIILFTNIDNYVLRDLSITFSLSVIEFSIFCLFYYFTNRLLQNKYKK